MKNVKLIALLLGVIALLAIGCTREITGDVQQADISSNNCFDCHDGADDLGPEVVLATRQWENSQHGSGNAMRTGSCAPCHTTEGFIESVTGEDYAGSAFNAVGCFACHDPHENGDFALRTTAAVTLGNGATYDRGISNLCVSCHKGRRDVTKYVVDSVKMSSHYGPHHSNQSDMLLGENAYEYDGYDYDNSWHTTGVADGCVKCHFDVSDAYDMGGHTFWMSTEEGDENTDACNVDGCHLNDTEIDDFDREMALMDFDDDGDFDEGVQTEIEDLLTELETLLLAAGLISGDPGDTHPNSIVVPDADSVGAVFNFEFVIEDKSNGIHNTRYAAALLISSINYMTTGDPEGAPARKPLTVLTTH